MKIIIAPAKKMMVSTDDMPVLTRPAFLSETEKLRQKLCRFTAKELQEIYHCNAEIAAENKERFARMDLQRANSPAIFSYTGLVFQHIAAGSMTNEELSYLQDHLRILSGFYGVLCPFDGITPYRLEMQNQIPGMEDMYSFWKDKPASVLEDDVIVNLASKEYSKAVVPYMKDGQRMITIVFAEEVKGKLLSRATKAKMARGDMVWYMAHHRIQDPAALKKYHQNYCFAPSLSDDETFVFLEQKENSVCL